MSGYRIWKTKDGRYVGDGHADALELVAGPADRQPDDFDPSTFEQAGGLLGVPAEPKPEPEVVEEVPAVEDERPEDSEPGEQVDEKVEPAADDGAAPEKPAPAATPKKAPAAKKVAKKAAAKSTAK